MKKQLPSWHPAYLIEPSEWFHKGWITRNGAHIFISDEKNSADHTGHAGAGRAKGIGANQVNVQEVNGMGWKRSGDLISHEGAPDTAQVDRYKEMIQSGQKIAPVLVTKESGGWGIEDGKHRFEAMRSMGETFIPTLNKDTASPLQMKQYNAATEADSAAIERLVRLK